MNLVGTMRDGDRQLTERCASDLLDYTEVARSE
jgi:hypothetical protein